MPLAPESGKDAEELLKAANDAAGHARILYATLMLFLLYCAITAASVTDEQLFRNGPIAIPLLAEAKVPVSVFFLIGPWLALTLHLVVLLQFHGLAEKVRSFDLSAERLLPKGREHLRQRFAGLPFLAWLSSPASLPHWVRTLYGVIAYITLVLAPLCVLLLMQLIFLKYQSVEITWMQRLAIAADCIFIWLFWPLLIPRKLAPAALPAGTHSWCANLIGILRPGFCHKRVRWLVVVTFGTSFCLFTVIGEWMDRSLWWQFEEIAKGEKDPNYFSAILFPIPLSLRHLDLRDRFITANILPPEQKILERSENAEKFQAVLDSIEGINLQNRNFRFVKLTDSAVPKGDFRNTDMRYANLEQSDLKNARFDDSVLVGANIAGANAAGSIFVRANLLGANLSNTILASTDFSDAIMNLTNLSGSRLLGARLLNSDIRGSILTRADFYGANVTKSDFRFSIVQNTNLTNIWSHVNSDYLPRSKTFYLEKLDILPDFSHSIIGGAEISGDIFLRKSMFLLCSFSIFSGDKLCQDSEIILNIESNRKREPDLIRLSPDNIIKKEALEKILELKNSLTTREININCIGASRHCIEKTEEFLQD